MAVKKLTRFIPFAFTFTFAFTFALIIAVTALSGCSRQQHLQGYLEGEYINLAVDYSGILKQLLITRGDWVKKGQLLFVLDSEPEASQLAQAKAQLVEAQKKLSDLETAQRQ